MESIAANWKQLQFTYDQLWKTPLSTSLPIRKQPFPEAECLPFFSGLLPDGQIRIQIADAKHISYMSVFKLLQNYGGEIAGAISLCEEEQSHNNESSYKDISEKEIANLIRNSATTPIILQDKARLSLAGAQQKLPLYSENNRWKLPLGNAPSSVIIKPSGKYTANEYISTKLAKSCGLAVPEMKLSSFEDQPVLIIKRYDRLEENGKLIRIHQEDFCQALGIMPENKYEEEGGPSFASCIRLIENNSSDPIRDLEAFLEMGIFNFFIRNCDAHGKNFSFLMFADGRIRLAPFYDLTSTAIYPELDRNTAMKYGNEKRLDRITYQDLVKIWKGNKMKEIIENIADSLPEAIQGMQEEAEEHNINDVLIAIAAGIKERRNRLTHST